MVSSHPAAILLTCIESFVRLSRWNEDSNKTYWRINWEFVNDVMMALKLLSGVSNIVNSVTNDYRRGKLKYNHIQLQKMTTFGSFRLAEVLARMQKPAYF